jgi:hypothetical protein
MSTLPPTASALVPDAMLILPESLCEVPVEMCMEPPSAGIDSALPNFPVDMAILPVIASGSTLADVRI